MPTYDYQCRSCGAVTEVIHSMLEDGPSVCERCGGQLRRVLYPTGIIFKGSGFYRTDSRESSSGESTKAKPAEKAAASTGSNDGSSGSSATGSESSSGATKPSPAPKD